MWVARLICLYNGCIQQYIAAHAPKELICRLQPLATWTLSIIHLLVAKPCKVLITTDAAFPVGVVFGDAQDTNLQCRKSVLLFFKRIQSVKDNTQAAPLSCDMDLAAWASMPIALVHMQTQLHNYQLS